LQDTRKLGEFRGISTQRFTIIEAPVDAEEFLFTLTKNIAENYPDVPIIFVSSEEPEATFPDLVESKVGWTNFNELKNVAVIDSYSRPADTGSIIGICTQKQAELGSDAGVLVIYSLSKLSLFMEETRLFAYLQDLINNVVLQRNFAMIALVDPSMHSETFLARIKRTSDLIIRVIVNRDMGFDEKFLNIEPITIPIRTPKHPYPYLLLGRGDIYFVDEIPRVFSVRKFGASTKKPEERTTLLTGIPPVDYRELADGLEVMGIAPLFSYAMKISESPVEAYPFIFTLVDTMIKENDMNVVMIYFDDSPDTFMYELEEYVKDPKKRKEFINFIREGRIAFIDCSRSEAMKIKEMKETVKKPLEHWYIDISDPSNAAEVLYYVRSFLDPDSESTKVKKLADGGLWGPFVIFITLSGAVPIMGFENTYKFVSALLGRYVWRATGSYTFWFIMNPAAFSEDEWNKIISLIDGEIEITSRNIYGIRRKYLRIVRIPKEARYITSWIPYIDTGSYPPGLIYLTPEYFGMDRLYVPRR